MMSHIVSVTVDVKRVEYEQDTKSHDVSVAVKVLNVDRHKDK